MRSRTAFAIFALFAVLTMLAAQSQKPKGVDRLKKSLGKVQDKKSQLRQQIKAKQRQAKAVMGDIEKVDARLTNLEDQLGTTTEKLAAGKQEQFKLARDLGVATVQLTKRRAQVRLRLRSMFMQGDTSPVTALLKSKDLGDLATRKAILERITEHDKELFEEVRSLQAQIAAKKKRQDQLVSEMIDLKRRQQSQQGELKGVRNEKKQYLGELHQQANDIRKELDELDRESRSLAAQIRAYQASRRGTAQEVRPSKGALLRPVSGPITSGFGYRFHPILKERRMHTGLDIGAPTGTKIHAAADGVVISASYMRGYGNAVVIDHGGGLSTLYGHCSRLFVSAGQRVRRGDVIAAVGMTGLATGPHLHFETRINGTPVNPLSRL